MDELVGAVTSKDEGPSVFVVDDASELTELYAGYLAGAGYPVRTFHHRAKALAALETAERKPHLLITDYMGSSMPVEEFLHACRLVVPDLRILMASGFHPMDTRFSRVRPDRFIRKPFTAEEFLQEVRTSLF
jgi:DNA-binding NtrC family response regulator